jgi:hypothetical protein
LKENFLFMVGYRWGAAEECAARLNVANNGWRDGDVVRGYGGGGTSNTGYGLLFDAISSLRARRSG